MDNENLKKIKYTRAVHRRKDTENSKGFIRKNKVEIIIALLVSLLLSSVITNKLFFIGYVPSGSMNPILQEGDRTFVNVIGKNIQRGNIYVFSNENELMVKRCIAIGGDHVKIENNNVYINSELQEESYVGSNTETAINMDIIVPEGKVFFLGDNRGNSYDARYWKEPFIDVSDIEGECEFILSPFSRFSKL